MTDNDKNIRTLIICFVLAILALIPLKIVEFKQIQNKNIQVLGEQTTEEIQLPNAEIL
ncbi:MAG: hypothetical protein WC895_02390 [Candidatus Shapirobacteria bacterium]|jgi:hypothetical protein